MQHAVVEEDIFPLSLCEICRLCVGILTGSTMLAKHRYSVHQRVGRQLPCFGSIALLERAEFTKQLGGIFKRACFNPFACLSKQSIQPILKLGLVEVVKLLCFCCQRDGFDRHSCSFVPCCFSDCLGVLF